MGTFLCLELFFRSLGPTKAGGLGRAWFSIEVFLYLSLFQFVLWATAAVVRIFGISPNSILDLFKSALR